MEIRVDLSRWRRRLAVRAVVCAFLWIVPLSITGEEQDWIVTPSGSEVRIHVAKSGVFSFAGHMHDVIAPALSGTIRFDQQRVEQAAIELTFDASALTVSATGGSPEDVPKIQEAMLSDKVLDVAKYPTIVFRSRQIVAETRNRSQMRLRVAGDLTLHGVTRSIEGPANVNLAGDQLTGTGTLIIKQTSFNIKPVSAGLGAVKVKDEVTVGYTFAAHREASR